MLTWVTSADVPDQVPWANPKPKDKKVHSVCIGETEKLHGFSEWNPQERDVKAGTRNSKSSIATHLILLFWKTVVEDIT